MDEKYLQSASYYGHWDVVKLLLEKRAEVEARSADGWTALHLAVFRRHEPIDKLLLESGADTGAKNGVSALHLAAK